ncbi:MAG TPA: hypothetical protein VNX68_06215, partial [Nitrosopumilaceae archaeon]|nr:hypothetical protein [Nitrosopumilaceae archaeon]
MNTTKIQIPVKPKRKLLPENLEINKWDDLRVFYEELKNRNISSLAELEKWILDISEVESVVSENMAWRYIKMTCNTADKELVNSYTQFITEIEPFIAPYSNALNK